MGCKGSKHALLNGQGEGPPLPRAPAEPRRYSGLVGRHSVALRSSSSSSLGTLSLDRAAAAAAAAKSVPLIMAGGGGGYEEAMMKAGNDGGAGKFGPFGAGWRPKTPAMAAPARRQQRRVAPRTPTKTPARAPEEINVWELMEGLDDGESDDDDQYEGEHEDGCGVARKARSAPGSPPAFDPEILDAFRKALDELSPASPPHAAAECKFTMDVRKKREIQTFPGIVRARVSSFQERIDAKHHPRNLLPPPPPPESARRVVVYLTSLRGVRHTYEACRSTSAVLRGYGVRVDERDLSLHAGYKDELRAVLASGNGCGVASAPARLPQVFADGRHLGGAEEVRRMHESGELGKALEECEKTALAGANIKGGGGAPVEACGGCGGVRFVPCDACSGSCKVFVEEEGAFRRCSECNENGLVRCPVRC